MGERDGAGAGDWRLLERIVVTVGTAVERYAVVSAVAAALMAGFAACGPSGLPPFRAASQDAGRDVSIAPGSGGGAVAGTTVLGSRTGGSVGPGGAIAGTGGGVGDSGGAPAGRGGGMGTGGLGTGNADTGGASTGGASTGGASTAGASTGGASTGGSSTGGSSTGGSSTGGASCPAPQMLCGTICKDTQSDAANCGRCGGVCGANQDCINGACQCVAPAQMCGGTCVDTSTDLHNCGACGHDCRFGTCTSTQCNPVLLATATSVNSLASDGSSVYALDTAGNVAGKGVLYGCPLAQCGIGGTMSVVRAGLDAPTDLLAVPSVGSVFVSQIVSGAVLNLSPTGTLKATITFPLSFLTYGLATDGTNLFVSTGSSSDFTGIQKTPLGGNTPSHLFAALPSRILYDSASNAIFARDQSLIFKCPLSATACATFYSFTGYQMNGFAVAGGKLFFALLNTSSQANVNGGLFSCPTSAATCTPTTLVPGSAVFKPFAVDADSSYVYTVMAEGAFRCAQAGCGAAPTMLFPCSPSGELANDATAIYATNPNPVAATWGVLRMAKQP